MDPHADTIQPELYYIADPMCSWCWGFSPVIAALREEFAGRVRMQLVTGGLRIGGSTPMSSELKETVLHHWHEVGEATGQPFGFDFGVPEGFIYNTEPACRAAVTVRSLDPDRAFPFFAALHRAFYVDNRDLTDAEVLADLAAESGLDRAAFAEAFASDEIQQETFDDFAFAQGLGITGFPSVVLKDARGLALLSYGYQPLDAIHPKLDEWLSTGEAAENDEQQQRAGEARKAGER
jgi:putative protein-disulfide isomerase